MWPYWLVFIIPSIVTIFESKISARNKIIFWYFFLVVLTFFVGFRYEVGGDWEQYEINYLKTLEGFDFFQISIKDDYVYTLIAYLSSFIIEDIIFLNFILAIIFFISLNYFIEKDSDYFLVLTGAIPLHILIVGMGFVRQAMAVSFFLIAIKYLTANKNIKSLISFIIGFGFHKTLFPMLFIFYFSKKNKFFLFITIIFAIFVSYFFYHGFLRMFYYYTGEGIHFISYGALHRIIIGVFFSFIFIIFSNVFINNHFEKKIYLSLSIVCILIFPFVLSYSSMVDRLCFYFIPIQLFVLMRLKKLFKNQKHYFFVKLFTIIFYLCIYFVWLNFGHHKVGWLPYKNLFFL